eukprot:4888409-Pyramimonas_sp.AAC.1
MEAAARTYQLAEERMGSMKIEGVEHYIGRSKHSARRGAAVGRPRPRQVRDRAAREGDRDPEAAEEGARREERLLWQEGTGVNWGQRSGGRSTRPPFLESQFCRPGDGPPLGDGTLPFTVPATPVAPQPPPGLSRSARARIHRTQSIEERTRDTVECTNLLGGYTTPQCTPERLSDMDNLLLRRVRGLYRQMEAPAG